MNHIAERMIQALTALPEGAAAVQRELSLADQQALRNVHLGNSPLSGQMIISHDEFRAMGLAVLKVHGLSSLRYRQDGGEFHIPL